MLGHWIPQFHYVLAEHAPSPEILAPDNFFHDTVDRTDPCGTRFSSFALPSGCGIILVLGAPQKQSPVFKVYQISAGESVNSIYFWDKTGTHCYL